MKVIPIPPDILDKVKQFDAFSDVDDAALQWMVDKCVFEEYEYNEYFFRPDDPVNDMYIIIEGGYSVYDTRGGQEREFVNRKFGAITGILPFSRLSRTRGAARTTGPTKILRLSKEHFTEMVNVSYKLTQNLVAVMVDRVRDFSQYRFQSEKLMALGRLSAGLAHELNNPAAAIVRSAEELYGKMEVTPDQFKDIMSLKVSAEETDAVNQVLWDRILAHKTSPRDLGFMEREEAKDELLDWLEERDIDMAEDVSDTFVDFGILVEDLEKIEAIMEERDMGPVLRWFDNRMSLDRIVSEIREASGRIARLIKSVKTYTHMDQGQGMEATDIHDGLRSTVVMMSSKFKTKNIRVEKEFDKDVPKINASVGELNQVWTNLIANAIDAMEKGGTLTLRTYRERNLICAEVQDDGAGIPPETVTKIWEPFYTTKAIGEGTGMGLDIVKKILDQHRARINVTSKPGETVFKLCFEIAE
ncbi:MAG: ATP-binding protein [Bacteroidota bacterium]